MTAEKSKLTLKSLMLKVNELKVEIKDVKEELADVKEELKDVKAELDNLKNKDLLEGCREKCRGEEVFKCKRCDFLFNSKKSLKLHMRETHTPKFECKFCEEIIGKNCELELHLKERHDEIEMFNCNKCEKKFVLKWRLTKHQEIHYNPLVIKCHYFNNNKCCPFEEIGCMFEHAFSSVRANLVKVAQEIFVHFNMKNLTPMAMLMKKRMTKTLIPNLNVTTAILN